MSFSNSSVFVFDPVTKAIALFSTGVSTPFSFSLEASYDGVSLEYVVSRAGYTKSIGGFVGGGSLSLTTTPTQRKDPDGTPAYQGGSSANISVSFSFSPSTRCFVDVGDASVSSQTIVDEIEAALETQNGCRFLAETGGSLCLQAVLAGQTYLLLGSGYRLRRASAADVNAAVDAYVISSDGVVIDGSNGGIQFLTAAAVPTVAEIVTAIWDESRAAHTTPGTYGATSEWTGGGGLDEAGVRAALGMDAADLDAQLADIKSGTGAGFKWPR